ncbi:MAG: cation transporter [Micrococcales bacterium]|nr:cation transporter [Micrococcales bacterium]
MGEGHSHASAATVASGGGKHIRALIIAFSITASYMLVEFIVGFAISSLALISDAAHMATDVIGLSMALAAILIARRRTTTQRTYGMYRIEILAALANCLLLFGVAVYVIYEAVQRFNEPPEIPGVPLLVVAVIGLIVNLTSFRLLSAGAKDSVNLKGASLEVLGDLLGSIGVIAAAIILITTGWPYADPIIGVGIGLFILPRTFILLRQTLRILIEAAPPNISVDEVLERLRGIDGVEEVHDLHIWTITSGIDSASGHVVLAPGADYDTVLTRVLATLREEYHIDHATIQCDPKSLDEEHLNSPI